MDRRHPDYAEAFDAYLRRGTPVPLNLKSAAKPTSHYIWRSRGDRRVRQTHQDNNGRIFAWDNPPTTGHPGDAPGCRCVAEPYTPPVNESIKITMSGVSDTGIAWNKADFVMYYMRLSGPSTIRIRDTGNLRALVKEYQRQFVDGSATLPSQIATAARKVGSGAFYEGFRHESDMTGTVFVVGHTIIFGSIRGTCKLEDTMISLSGTLNFELNDIFIDALDVWDKHEGDQDLPFSKPYKMIDAWQGRFSGRISLDEAQSLYKTEE